MSEQKQPVTPVEMAHLRPWFYATKPTRGTEFLRTFLPWQIWRFLRINLKMITIIGRSHGAHK